MVFKQLRICLWRHGVIAVLTIPAYSDKSSGAMTLYVKPRLIRTPDTRAPSAAPSAARVPTTYGVDRSVLASCQPSYQVGFETLLYIACHILLTRLEPSHIIVHHSSSHLGHLVPLELKLQCLSVLGRIYTHRDVRLCKNEDKNGWS